MIHVHLSFHSERAHFQHNETLSIKSATHPPTVRWDRDLQGASMNDLCEYIGVKSVLV